MSRLSLILLPLIVGCTEQTLNSGNSDALGEETPSDIERTDDQRDLPGADDLDSPDDDNEVVQEFRSTLRGDFGDMGQFAADVTEIEASIGPDRSSITVHTLGEHGWAMLRLNVNGQLGQGRLRPGETVYLSGFSIEPVDDEDVVDGSAQGCTGPDMWNFDDDLFTDEAVIGLSQHPQTGALVVSIEADFSDGSHMVASAAIE